MAIVAAVGAIIGAGAAVVGVIGASRARKAQRRIDEARAARERTQQFRQARIAAGAIKQAGITSGAGLETSAVTQGQQGVVQQARGNISFVETINQLQNRLASAHSLINLAAGIGAFGSAVSGAANAFGPKISTGSGKSQPNVVPKFDFRLPLLPAPVLNFGGSGRTSPPGFNLAV